MELIVWEKIRKEILQRQGLWFQLPQAKKPPEVMAEEKTKVLLRRTERMEREHEVLATLVLLCLLNVVRGGRTTVSRLATRHPKSKA
jgi:hypothetical protein